MKPKYEKKEKITAIFPLTPMQEGLLYIWLLDKHSAAYFIQLEISCRGEINPQLLDQSFNKLIERHIPLRTVFVFDKIKKPMQIVMEKRQEKINFHDISRQNDEQKKSFLEKFRQEDKEKGVDLTRDLLVRLSLVKTSDDTYTIFWSFHHILLDAWSSGTLFKDLLQIYLALNAGQPVALPPPVPFDNYMDWLNRQDKQEGIAYWQKYLEGFDQVSLLPGHTKPVGALENAHKAQIYTFEIPAETTNNLQEMARENQVTMSVLMQTLWGILLQKYNNTNDVVFGTVVSGRNSEIADIDQMVGMFANTIPTRIKVNPGMNFSQLLQQAGAQFRRSQMYEYLPLPDIQSLTPLKNRLINHLFVFENYPFPNDINKVKTESDRLLFQMDLAGVYQQGNYDFSIIFVPGKRLQVKIIYNAFAYPLDSIKRITGHFAGVAAQFSQNPNLDPADLEIITPGEKVAQEQFSKGLYYEFPVDASVLQLIEKNAAENPGSLALFFENQILNYEELNNRANQLAYYLKERGLGPGHVAGVLLERSFSLIITILAVLKTGAAYLPLDPEYPAKRIMQICGTSGCTILLTSENSIAHIPFTQLVKTGQAHIIPVQTPPRPQITDYDSLPFLDRTLIDYKKYHRYIGVAPARHTVCIQATRGCPYNCAYCHKIWPKKHVVRSADNIFAEVKIYYDAGIRRFVIIDDIFNLKEDNSRRFLERVIRENMKIQIFFSNGLRGDVLSKEFIDLMVEAGTVDITLALETASPRLQKLLRKNLDLEKFEDNCRYIAQKYPQVILEMEMMLGFPSETEAEAQMTLDFLQRQRWVHFPDLHILKVYPNTDMYRLAIKNGVSREAIERSRNLAYHELPDTLPFSKNFARQCQAIFLNEYFLLKERLLQVLPTQMKILTENEIIQKYDSYLPMDIHSLHDLLQVAGIQEYELTAVDPMLDSQMAVPDFNEKMRSLKPAQEKQPGALRILLLDLSQWFTKDSKNTLYNVVSEPMGLMSLLSYLDKTFGDRIQGKIKKSRVDFDSFMELKTILLEFKPNLIGLRTLTYYKEFFHKTISLIRQWGIDVPIICGGPYATSDYEFTIQDTNIDLVVLGEGEYTLAEIVENMLANNHKLPPEEVLQTIRGIAFIKKSDKILLKENNRHLVFIDHIDRELEHCPTANLNTTIKPGDLFYLISTSGSTGVPKSVMLSHGNLLNLVHFELTGTNIDFSKVLQFASIGFDVSAQEIFSTLAAGGELFLIPSELKLEIDQLLDFLARNNIKTIFVPPVFLKYIFSEPMTAKKFPTTIKHIVCAGEALNIRENLRDFLRENSVYIHNHYGPSETHVVTSVTLDPRSMIPEQPSIGKPIFNTQVFILDSRFHMQPVEVAGELHIAGANVGKGYYLNEELTRSRFREIPLYTQGNVYATGDMAVWLPDGNIKFLGRLDNQVKIRGFRVELPEIETVLRQITGITEAVVIVRSDQNQENQIYAYFVAQRKIDLADLKNALTEALPHYMIPAYFIQLEQIPFTINRKIDRNALPVPAAETAGTLIQPQNALEQKLADTWSELLEIDVHTLSIDDDFFERGGHSLKATVLIAKIHKIFGIKIPVGDFFKMATIRKLGEYITANEQAGSSVPADEHLVLLKKVPVPLQAARHLFLIHDGTGEVDGYLEFCRHLSSDVYCWGLNASKINSKAPVNIHVGDLAARYMTAVKKVQNHGPFYIAGWSTGGTIAFELARQFEQMGEQVGTLVFFDSIAPHPDLRKYFPEFTAASELNWLEKHLPGNDWEQKFAGCSDLEQCWDRLIQELEIKNYLLESLKKLIPQHMVERIPRIDNLKINEWLPYLNRIRTLLTACGSYVPTNKINTEVHFFRASASVIENKTGWQQYCAKPLKFYEVTGDHFSIFKEPRVINLSAQFAAIINQYI